MQAELSSKTIENLHKGQLKHCIGSAINFHNTEREREREREQIINCLFVVGNNYYFLVLQKQSSNLVVLSKNEIVKFSIQLDKFPM